MCVVQNKKAMYLFPREMPRFCGKSDTFDFEMDNIKEYSFENLSYAESKIYGKTLSDGC